MSACHAEDTSSTLVVVAKGHGAASSPAGPMGDASGNGRERFESELGESSPKPFYIRV